MSRSATVTERYLRTGLALASAAASRARMVAGARRRRGLPGSIRTAGRFLRPMVRRQTRGAGGDVQRAAVSGGRQLLGGGSRRRRGVLLILDFTVHVGYVGARRPLNR